VKLMNVAAGQKWKNKHTGAVVFIVQVLKEGDKYPVVVVEFKKDGEIRRWALNGADETPPWHEHWDRV